MARCTTAAIFLAAIFSVIINDVSSCSLIGDYSPLTLTQRASLAETIVYGYVTAHYPIVKVINGSEELLPIDRRYTAEMEIYCVFKGAPLPERVNVTDAGRLTSCDYTELLLDKEYIAFLKIMDGSYFPDEVNIQTAAVEARDDYFYYISKASGVEVNDDGCTNYSGSYTIACFQTGTDHESCAGVGGLKASFGAYVLVLLTWTFKGWIG